MSYRFPNSRLIVFSKAPVPGYCKTRVAEQVGNEAAANLQKELIQSRIAESVAASFCPVELWCAPETTHPFFQNIAANYPVSLHQQQGNGLGQRMLHAVSANKADYTIIIGTDCPVMSNDYLSRAYQSLHNGHELVIGPAEDGGYVLLGFHLIREELFTDIAWGTASVLQQTLQAVEQSGVTCQMLETLWDLDRPEDYQRYQAVKQAAQK